MPRRLIPFIPVLHYHIYNRGNNRERIFFEPDNYLYFLMKIKEYLVPVADVLVYCLMPTHYHVVGRVKLSQQTSEILKISAVSKLDVSGEVSKAMIKLSVSYTKAINKRFQRAGVLFQGSIPSLTHFDFILFTEFVPIYSW